VAKPSTVWYGDDDDDNGSDMSTCKIITNRILLLT
jgi:hypothetical protein